MCFVSLDVNGNNNNIPIIHHCRHTAESLKPEMENPDSEIAGKWLVLSVEFKAKCTVDVLEQKTKKVQSTIVDASPKIFKFANGPLPNNLPVRQLESAWWVYAFS